MFPAQERAPVCGDQQSEKYRKRALLESGRQKARGGQSRGKKELQLRRGRCRSQASWALPVGARASLAWRPPPGRPDQVLPWPLTILPPTGEAPNLPFAPWVRDKLSNFPLSDSMLKVILRRPRAGDGNRKALCAGCIPSRGGRGGWPGAPVFVFLTPR